MKVKMKFDLASIKSWLFEHGEKLAFGTMVLVFLMFAYSALQREVLDPTKGETRLSETARAVTDHVSKSTWDVKNAGVQIVDYKERAKRDPVPPEFFATSKPLSGPIFDPKGKRDDPEIFSIEEPRAGAGMGTFALKGAGAPAGAAGGGQVGGSGGRGDRRKPGGGGGVRPSSDSKLKSQAWAVVTALVPIEKQAAEYNRVFSHAMGEVADRDIPHYTRPIVERAEIDVKNPDKFDWKPLGPLTASQADWEGGGEEIVDAKYFDPSLTFRLGPLVGASWNESVTHPKIPPTWVAGAAEVAAPVVPAAAPAGEVAAQAKPAAAPPPAPRTVSHKLLRVFDYTVQPNHRYRYRVNLELKNPNFGLNVKFLKNPAAPLNSQELRTSEKWSDPTDVVTIPSGFDVLAASVEPKLVEPSANLLLTALNRADGIPASTKTRTYRGSLANKKESRVLATDPRNNKVIVIDEVDFNSGIVVVDIYGGKTVSNAKSKRETPFAAPGEVLLLDANGNLTVHNDLEDHDQFLSRQPPDEADAARAEPEKTTDDKGKKASRTKSGR